MVASKAMPNRLKEEMLDSIERRVSSYLDGRIYGEEVASTLNFILYDEFNKERINGNPLAWSLKPVFVGEYRVDPAKPSQTRLFCHQGTEACSPIPIIRGVIGRAIREGKDQYVADVTADPEHVSCDPNMEGSELVIVKLSDPYSITNPYGIGYVGKRVPKGVIDIDWNVKDALSNKHLRERLIKTLRPCLDRIFPGEANYAPSERMAVLD
jgi:putative methionine-R-sulfoxide reductase with GAF domain